MGCCRKERGMWPQPFPSVCLNSERLGARQIKRNIGKHCLLDTSDSFGWNKRLGAFVLLYLSTNLKTNNSGMGAWGLFLS